MLSPEGLAVKSWTLSDDLQARPDLAAAVEKLRPVLDGHVVPAESAGLVSADWRLDRDEDGHEVAVLRLADPSWPAGVERPFGLRKLSDKYSALMSLHLLWGSLLQAANEVRIARILQAAEAD